MMQNGRITPLRLGSRALLRRASDLARVMREALGHHVEALFRACFPGEGSRREAPDVQEFISKAIEEIQEGFCKAIVTCRVAHLTAPVRVRSYASASTSPGSTGSHLGSSCGCLVSTDARVRHTARSQCLLAWRARLRRSSAA